MSGAPKKIVNDPRNVVDELLEGLHRAGDGRLAHVAGFRGVVRADLPPDRVGVLIGGGSGHEPIFPGFVGPGMADGAACGNIFAAPAPPIILDVAQAVDRGKGVLFIHGNYAGDNMNFAMASELCEDEGIATRTVRVYDDVASAPPAEADKRRGIAGDLLVIKAAGAAALESDELAYVEAAAIKARDNVRTLAVAVRAGSIPETGHPTFELGDDEIEIGMGGHGEPGVERRKMTPADPLVDDMIAMLLGDLPFKRGDRVALVLNDMGATTMMELYIVNRRVRQILDREGIAVHRTEVGRFIACQEMAGFSISLMRLDDDLQRWVDAPADALGYRKV
ncbi:MAG: dihydroxyacetone kinase subunit DhaK [Rhodospirillaceae bacterium]|nr:dihydroxyacetone kinase subunit DhaK [Rhodospirillaceae bacterium]